MDTKEASNDYDRSAAAGHRAGDTRLGGSGLRGGARAMPGDPPALPGGQAQEVRETGTRGLRDADDNHDHHDDNDHHNSVCTR